MDERSATDGRCTRCGESLHGDPYQHSLCYDCREAEKLPYHGIGKAAYLRWRLEGFTQQEAAIFAGIGERAGRRLEKNPVRCGILLADFV